MHRNTTLTWQTERHSKVIDSGRRHLSDTEVFPAMAFPVSLKSDISSVMLNNLTNLSVPGTSVWAATGPPQASSDGTVSSVNHCNATEELLQAQICKFWAFLQYCLPTSFLVVKNRAAGSIFWLWVLQFHHPLQKYSQNASLLNSVCKYMQHWINFCKSPHQNTDPTHSCALKQAGHPGDHHMHLAMAFPDSAEA